MAVSSTLLTESFTSLMASPSFLDLPPSVDAFAEAASEDPPPPEDPPDEPSDELVLAVHRYLARTPGQLLMVQLEDALGEEEQPNLPGAMEHPNWRRRLGRDLEGFADQPMVGRIADAMAAAGRSCRG